MQWNRGICLCREEKATESNTFGFTKFCAKRRRRRTRLIQKLMRIFMNTVQLTAVAALLRFTASSEPKPSVCWRRRISTERTRGWQCRRSSIWSSCSAHAPAVTVTSSSCRLFPFPVWSVRTPSGRPAPVERRSSWVVISWSEVCSLYTRLESAIRCVCLVCSIPPSQLGLKIVVPEWWPKKGQ